VVLTAPDGARLCGELILPQTQAPRAAVALSHAMMVDRRTLDTRTGQGLLGKLVTAGAAVLWFDQRGHGQSRPLPEAGASWDYDTLVRDVEVVAAYLAERFPGLPRAAVGHSLFGHVALAHETRVAAGLAKLGFSRLVLFSANVWLRQLEPDFTRYLCKRASFLLLVAASRPLGYLPVRRLGIGTADEPYDYLAQMGGWVGADDWTARDGFSYLQALGGVRTPILSIVGAGDRLLAVPECQERFVRRSAGPVTHVTVGKRFGYASDPDHMGVVLDDRLAPLWREAAAWVCGGEFHAPKVRL
jgi:predicted alpha/beta hydrolase